MLAHFQLKWKVFIPKNVFVIDITQQQGVRDPENNCSICLTLDRELLYMINVFTQIVGKSYVFAIWIGSLIYLFFATDSLLLSASCVLNEGV